MRPIRLELEAFLSYREPTIVNFDGLSAVAIVGPNGAGKTSIIEAMAWALYGEGRGHGPDDFVCAGSTRCRVAFDFDLEGKQFRVERQRQLGTAAKSSLGLFHVRTKDMLPMGGDRISETQAAIERLLGMDYATWSSTAFIGQGQADAFTRMRPAERKELLAEVLGLSRYQLLADAARTRARELGADADSLGRRVRELEAQIETAGDLLTELERTEQIARRAAVDVEAGEADLTGARQDLEAARAAATEIEEAYRIRDELGRQEALVAGLEERAGRVVELDRRFGDISAQRTSEAGAAVACRDRETEYRERQQASEQKLAHLGEVVTTIAERMRVLEHSTGATCYACGQDLSPELRHQLHASLKAEADRVDGRRAEELGAGREAGRLASLEGSNAVGHERAVQRLEDDARAIIRELEGARADQARLGEELIRFEDLRGRAGALPVDADAARLRVAAASGSVTALERTLTELRETQLRAERDHARAEERMRELERIGAALDSFRAQAADAGREQHLHEVLANAFGRNGIPALIIEVAIPDLEVQANHLLERLTAGRFRVRIDSLRATKTAGVKEALDITVGDDVSERPLEALSGGERQCVDLALRVALSRMLAHRAGRPIEMLVIDEGFTALDAAHKQRTVQLLHDLLGEFASVLFVTHLTELADAFPSRIQVERTDEGSRVRVEGDAA